MAIAPAKAHLTDQAFAAAAQDTRACLQPNLAKSSNTLIGIKEQQIERLLCRQRGGQEHQPEVCSFTNSCLVGREVTKTINKSNAHAPFSL